MKNGKRDFRQIILSSLAVLILIVAVIGISYAVWSRTFRGTKENSITTDTISFSYIESETNNIYITDALPMTDSNGKNLNGDKMVFDFTVSGTNGSGENINYDVYAIPYEQTLPSEYIKVYITDQNNNPVEGYGDDTKVPTYASLTDFNDATTKESGSKILYSSSLSPSTKNENLRLRVWLSEDYNIPEKSLTFAFKVNVRARM